MKAHLLVQLGLLISLSVALYAQAPPSNLDQLQAKERLNAKLREEEEQLKKAAEMKLQRGSENANLTNIDAARTFFNSENDLPANEKTLLSVDANEAQKYSQFLRQPDTGFFKLLNYQDAKAGISDAKSRFAYPRLRGGGTFYSFSKRNHIADEWAQLHLQDGILHPAYVEMKRTTVVQSGGVAQSFVYSSGYNLTLLTSLGNVPLEEISLQTSALQPLLDIQPPKQHEEFVRQGMAFKNGFQNGAQRFQSSLPVRVDTSYVMRSINYKKADVMVAFRIVQQNADGSVHILWKLLKSFPPPDLKGKKP